jgi:phosphate transport system substrate-binding protein
MKRFFSIFVAVCFLLSIAGLAIAQGPAKKVEYDGGTNGKVVFDGKTHAAAGLKCADCHTEPKLFGMKKTALKMAEMKEGKSCGACHDGKKAFAVSECAKCHKK